ncbi:DUF2513 domain-containing protein [Paenibacillus popilliae]|uniref:DUF2513 domain-containing protein n=1 Tax=Paenibacillus popilliae ATCC 14706 TaxID=1212764 RepID=M9M1J6_PAEPP|nr:DUF2513 domain-containing protein [Paenibacillus popilliae]GAC42774.1 hypothetical protein PPOP_2134 [Paenibacillus popilliae ATCC 14706]
MKLQHDCVRDLLLTIEEELPLGKYFSTGSIHEKMQQYSKEDIFYTALKLLEAGYIDATEIKSIGLNDLKIKSLTYFGHLFLDNIRDDRIWVETKSAASKLSGVSLTVLAELASSYVKRKLGLV